MHQKKKSILTEAVVCSLCLMVFSFFIQYDFPARIVAFVALLGAAFIISNHVRSFSDLQKIFGVETSTVKFLFLTIAGILIGFALAVPYRNYHHWGSFPVSFRYFTIIAALIGYTEELVFRGFLQEFVKEINGWFSILFSTISHTGYKFFLFLAPVIIENVDLRILFFWTFGVGLFFGIVRHYSKSIWLPLAAHMMFDIISYAEFVQSPWWVW